MFKEKYEQLRLEIRFRVIEEKMSMLEEKIEALTDQIKEIKEENYETTNG